MENVELNLKSIGSNIRNYRKQKNLSQEQLAEFVDVSSNYISQIELGKKFPSLDVFVKLLIAIDTPADLVLSEVTTSTYSVKVSELNDRIKDLPIENQKFIYSVVDTMVNEMKK